MDSPSVFPLPIHPCSVAPPPSYLSPHHKPLDHFASSFLPSFACFGQGRSSSWQTSEERKTERGHRTYTARMGEEQEKSSQLEIRATPQPQQQPSHLLELLTGWSVIREDSPPPARPTVCARFVWKAVFSQVQKIVTPNPGARSDKWACGRKVVASPFKNSLDSPQRIG